MLGQTLAGLAQTFAPVVAAQAHPEQVTDAALLALQKQTDSAGKPTWPKYQGLTADQMRAIYVAEASAPRHG